MTHTLEHFGIHFPPSTLEYVWQGVGLLDAVCCMQGRGRWNGEENRLHVKHASHSILM